jgi:hypothetical protein
MFWCNVENAPLNVVGSFPRLFWELFDLHFYFVIAVAVSLMEIDGGARWLQKKTCIMPILDRDEYGSSLQLPPSVHKRIYEYSSMFEFFLKVTFFVRNVIFIIFLFLLSSSPVS